MRLVKLGGRLWAVGLDWFQISAGRKRDMAKLRSEAKEARLAVVPDMVAFRARQYGFGASGGMVAYRAANPLAGGLNLPSSSFLGVFHLEDMDGESFWWVCAVRQGLISGQADKLYTTRKEADAQVDYLTDLLGGFEEHVVRPTWAESEAWLTSLTTYRRSARLHPLMGSPDFRLRVIAACAAVSLLLVCGGGFKAYMAHKAEQREIQANLLQARELEQRRSDLLAHPERQFAMPWTQAQPVQQTALVCFESMLSLPLSVGGWEMAGAKCDGRVLTVFWDFQPGADYRQLPPDAVLETSTRARSRVRLASDPTGKRSDADFHSLPGKTDVSRHFYQITANIGAFLSDFKFAQPERAVVDKVEVVAPWMRCSWTLSAVPDALVLDGSLAAALDVPGLVLSSVEYENGWTLKGEVYATPQ